MSTLRMGLVAAFAAVTLGGLIVGVVVFVRAVSTHSRTRPRPWALLIIAATLLIAGIAGLAVAMTTSMRGHMMAGMGGRESGRSGASAVPGAIVLDVTAREFSFRPSVLRIRVGQTFNVRLTNGGSMFHTFTVSDLGFELRAEAGESLSGSLRANRAGSFAFICSVPGHAQAGMRGTVFVT